MRLFNRLYFKLHKHDVKFLIDMVEREIECEECSGENYDYWRVCKEVLANLEEY